MMAHSNAHDDHGAGESHGVERAAADHRPHILPVRTYLGVFAALVALTAITVGVSYVSFGAWNLVIALVVATTKAALVALIFMHLRYDARFNSIVIVAALVFLGAFIGITRSDLAYRGDADPIERERVPDISNPFAPRKAPAVTKSAAPPAH
jgi:cytochrome c oxidase subunit 4